MPQEFYDVKTKSKVTVADKDIYKTTFTSETGQVRYGLRGKTSDGRPLTKFVSKETWDSMKVEVKAEEKKKAADKKAPAKKEEKKPEKKAADKKAPAKKEEKKADKKPAAKKPAAKKK
jgi:hypothetical protein